MSDILIVESGESTAKILKTMLKTEGYSVDVVANAVEAGKKVSAGNYRLVIIDAGHSIASSLNFIETTHKAKQTSAIIVIADNEEISEEVRRHVFSVMEKPLRMDDLLTMVQRAIDYSDNSIKELKDLSTNIETAYQFDGIIAESPAMRSVCDMISRVAATDVVVMMIGEKGTGKSLVANTIKNHSARKDKKYSVVACSGASGDSLDEELFGANERAGVFESTNGGTVFFRDVEQLAHGTQLKLYKTLHTREISRGGKAAGFDVRILVSATDGLPEYVESGRFRQDLYRFLKAIVIKVPPLRDHTEDIKPLVSKFLRSEAPAGRGIFVVLDDAMKALEAYSWPGNVAELRDVMKSAMESCEREITVAALPEAVRKSTF